MNTEEDKIDGEQKKVFERDWQLCCSVYEEKLGRFRVSVYYRVSNPEMAIRPVMDHVKTRTELGLPEQAEEFFFPPTTVQAGLRLIQD